MKLLIKLVSIVVLGCLASGCNSVEDNLGKKSGPVHILGPEWNPLKRIEERGSILGRIIKSDTAITTLGETAYVDKLNEWLSKHPPGSLTYKAVLTHEQKHAYRQKKHKLGVDGWLLQYLVDKDFALEEEQIGWYYQITVLASGGVGVNREQIARILSSYELPTGKLISYEKALIWVSSVVEGRWKPKE